jgi:hypothetical protein
MHCLCLSALQDDDCSNSRSSNLQAMEMQRLVPLLPEDFPRLSLQKATTTANLHLPSPKATPTSSDEYVSQTGHSSNSSSRKLQALEQQRQQVPSLPEALLSRGYKGLAPAVLRNWRQLADKLNTPGSPLTVVTFGGSITGDLHTCSDQATQPIAACTASCSGWTTDREESSLSIS